MQYLIGVSSADGTGAAPRYSGMQLPIPGSCFEQREPQAEYLLRTGLALLTRLPLGWRGVSRSYACKSAITIPKPLVKISSLSN